MGISEKSTKYEREFDLDHKSRLDMKNNKTPHVQSRKALLLYIYVMLILYVSVCMASGHPNWILGVFAQNTGSDLIGETWRSLGSQLNMVQLMFEFPSDNMIPEAVAIGIVNDLPKTMQFTCINGLFQRIVPPKDKLSSVLFFVAGYLLQAMIAVSWELCSESGVTFESAILSWQKFYSKHLIGVALVMLAILLISYIAKRCGHGLEEFLKRHSETTSSIFNIFCLELLRAFLLIGLFGLTLQIMEEVTAWIRIKPVGRAVEFLKVFWFLLLNYWLNKSADVLVDAFGFEKNALAQDVFCAIISVIVLVVCVALYFAA